MANEQARETQAGGFSEDLDGNSATATSQIERVISTPEERGAVVDANNIDEDVSETIEKLQAENDKLQNERAELLEKVTGLQNDFLGLQDEIAEHQNQIVGLFDERTKLQAELKRFKAHATSQMAFLRKQKEVLDILTKAHSRLKSANEAYLEVVREYEALEVEG